MAPLPQYLSGDISAIQAFLDRFDTFLFDCDGKRIVFVTNNSTKSRVEYKKKLDDLGVPAEVDEIFGSAYASAVYISRLLQDPPPRNKVFILGESGIETELQSVGISTLGGTDASLRRDMQTQDFASIADGSALDPDVSIVLCGLDYHVNYLKLSLGYHYLRRGARFLATNTDSTLPSCGALFPGAGTVANALTNMTGLQPLVMGKPSTSMMDAIHGKFNLNKTRTCMVGDRLNTDIRFGIEGALGGTLAVLTGVCRREEWERDEEVWRPGWYVDRLGDLREGLRGE